MKEGLLQPRRWHGENAAHGGGQAAGPQGVQQTQRLHSCAHTQEAWTRAHVSAQETWTRVTLHSGITSSRSQVSKTLTPSTDEWINTCGPSVRGNIIHPWKGVKP